MILHLSPRGFWYQTVLQSTIQGVYYGLVSYDGWVELWFCFMSSMRAGAHDEYNDDYDDQYDDMKGVGGADSGLYPSKPTIGS